MKKIMLNYGMSFLKSYLIISVHNLSDTEEVV